MDQNLTILLSCTPFALLLFACLLRAIVTTEAERPSTAARRNTINFISYLISAIAMFGMLFLMLTVGAIGFIGMLLALFVFFTLFDAEIRIAGTRNRARQIELVWLLALAVRSGRPLAEEVEAYAQGTWGKRHRLLIELAQRLREGVPLTELAVPQGLIPRSAALQIHTGIISSSLHDSLRSTAIRVTRELSGDQSDAENMGAAIVYPAAVVPIALLVVAFVMYYIIPKFKKIFDDFGTELPQPTMVLVHISDVVATNWILLLLPFFYLPLCVFIFAILTQYYGWRVVLQSTFGQWFIRWSSPEVMRALAQCVNDGVPLDQSLYAIAKHPGPLRLRERLAWAIDAIQGGAPTWQTLQATGLLRHSEAVVLESAEKSGNLPWALETLAAQQERQTAFRLAAFAEIARPVILIGMSVVVGFFSIAIFLPLVKLLNDLS